MKNQEVKLNIFDYIVAFICADFISASIMSFFVSFDLWSMIILFLSFSIWNTYEQYRISGLKDDEEED
jgi:hypothetical protein